MDTLGLPPIVIGDLDASATPSAAQCAAVEAKIGTGAEAGTGAGDAVASSGPDTVVKN